MISLKYLLCAGFNLLLAKPLVAQQASGPDIGPLLDQQNIRWDVPGPTSAHLMPIGNGDIGLNVWVEPCGDLVFYMGKTDGWNEDVRSEKGLIKLGEVRVSVVPSPLGAGALFSQVLKLHTGEIQIKEGADGNAVTLRVWVDASPPVIRVEAKSDQPVSFNDWRITPQDETNTERILTDQKDRIVWYHSNPANADPHIANLTTGATIKGAGFVNKDMVRSDPRLKFPAFWVKGNDYAPDEDNGGNSENGFQQMLMQTDGRNILLLPAWPVGWDADFKLNAPFQTTVQGSVVDGKLANLIVTPPERKADIIDMSLSSTSLPVADRPLVDK